MSVYMIDFLNMLCFKLKIKSEMREVEYVKQKKQQKKKNTKENELSLYGFQCKVFSH